MGTNYYLNPEAPCVHCGLVERNENIHIGKLSAGWRFLFHAYPEKGLTSTLVWETYLHEVVKAGGCIVGDGDERVPPEKFLALVRDRAGMKMRDVDRHMLPSDGVADFMLGYFS